MLQVCGTVSVNDLIIHNLILRSVHVQQGVELGEAGRFGCQVFLIGEGLIHCRFGFLQLPAGVGQVILRVLQAGGQAFEGIVQALDVAVEIYAERRRMAQAADQGDLVLPAQGIIIQLHSEAPIPSQGNGIRALHGTAGFQNRGACRFLFSKDGSFDFHGREAIFIWVRADLDALDVVSVALLPLLQIPDFLRELMDDLILQGIPLAQMVGLEKLQSRNLNVQIHLLLDVRIACTEGLDLGIRQRLLVNVLRRTHRALARHNLPDELLLAFHQLIKVAVKGVLRHVGIDLYFRILITLTDQSPFALL